MLPPDGSGAAAAAVAAGSAASISLEPERLPLLITRMILQCYKYVVFSASSVSGGR